MAFDRIEPPDMWQSATCKLLYYLVCAWSSGKPPRFDQFFPNTTPESPMSDDQILMAFGVQPGK